MEPNKALENLIRLAGTQTILGATLGVSQSAVAQWVERGYVPMHHLGAIRALYNVDTLPLTDPKLVAFARQLRG